LSGVYDVLGQNIAGFTNATTATSPNMVLRNIAAQCVQNVHGFIRGFSNTTEAELKQASSLDEHGKILLSKPSHGIVGNGGSIVIEQVTSPELARAIRVAADNMSSKLRLVVISNVEGVLKPLSDFAMYDVSSQSFTKNGPVTITGDATEQTAVVSNNTPREWDVCISYQPGEGQDVARSLALDLVKFGRIHVWFDKDRATSTARACVLGVAHSKGLVTVWTAGTRSNTIAHQENPGVIAEGVNCRHGCLQRWCETKYCQWWIGIESFS
jgi:hypothetical protein